MELEPHLVALRASLDAAAAVGGQDVATAARLLGDAAEPALRLVLMDLLTEAAAELTDQLGGAVVEVRLHGRDPELVASAPTPLPQPPAEDSEAGEGEDSSVVRITLRLAESLKNRCEAAAGAEGQSLNSWLVDAADRALRGADGGWPFPGGGWPFPPGPPGPRGPRGPRGPFPPGFPFTDRPGRSGTGRRVTGFGQA